MGRRTIRRSCFVTLHARSLAFRVYVPLALLAALGLGISLVTFVGIRGYQEEVRQLRHTHQRALLAERVNGHIFATVMDMRGIIIAQNESDFRGFAEGVMGMRDKLGNDLAEWQALLP